MIQAVAPGDDYGSEVRPDGVSTFRHYLHAVWRRKWIGLAALVAIPLVTLVATLRQQSLYEASADVLINRQEVATTSLIGQTPALDDASRTMETQVRLARVPLVLERTLAAAGLEGGSTSQLRNHSSVFPLADVLRFTVSDQSPDQAARLASAYAREFVRYRRGLDTVGLARTLAELRGQMKQLEAAGKVDSPLYARLADREQQLVSLETLRRSNVSVVQTAGAGDAEKVAPRPRRNTAFAVVAGLVVGLILIFLWESLSTKPRSESEFEALLGMPFLARLGPGTNGTGPSPGSPITPDADAVHTLRTNLQLANADVGAKTIMVTSPRSGEGKSSAAVQLAVALARAGRRVALVDLDLRHSSLTRLFGLDGRPGVTAIARGECDLDEALVSFSVEHGQEGSSVAGSNGRSDAGALLEVVPSGALDVHPAELLSSDGLAAVLAELGRRADLVLVDVPALLEAPDAAAVTAQIDGLLLVVSARRARGPVLADVRRAIDAWPVAKLGFALTEERGRSRASPPLVVEHPRRTHVTEPEQVT